MTEINDLLQSSDFKKEKHVPVIEAPSTVKKAEQIEVIVSIGKEISHPNTTQHHISWISIFFLPDGENIQYKLETLFSMHMVALHRVLIQVLYIRNIKVY